MIRPVLILILFFYFTITAFLHHSNILVQAARHHHSHSNKHHTTNNTPSPTTSSPASNPDLNQPPESTVPSDPSPNPNPEDPPDDDDNDPTSCVFDVTSFGAVGDGSSDDTDAFQKAWKAACGVENGVVLAPAGKLFTVTSTIFNGPCKPGLVFQMDGVLMAPDGPDCWPDSDSKRQWLVFYRLDSGGFTLTGKGTVDGNGHKWWELPCKPHRGPQGSTLPGPCDSPAMIRFFMSSNLTLTNLRIQNSPQFHIKFDGCNTVNIENLSINSPHTSPNTDGIHLQDTTNVIIQNSIIANGDDCVSIGTGCRDVNIDGITCQHSHGISIGSLGPHNTQACVSNISVKNSVIRDSDNGLRIKTWQGGSGSVTGISFEDITIENTKNCIIIDQYYCLSKGCRNQTSAVYLSGVTYRNIKGTYNVSTAPIHFACSDTVPCTNITMSEVELLPAEGELVDDPFCWNTYGTQETLTIPPIDCFQEGMPESVVEGQYDCTTTTT